MSAVRAFSRLLAASICALAPLAWTAGCGILGGQGTDSGGECRDEQAELGSDEHVAPMLGFAPSDVLSWASGSRSVSARWNEPPMGTTASSSPGPVDVVVGIERAQGPAFEVDPDDWCGGGPYLRIPVTVSFTSADGQLDERLAGVLTAERSDFVRVSADVELDQLRGELEWRSSTRSIGLVQPTLELVLTREGSTGSFGAIVETRTATSVSIGGAVPGADPGAGGRVLHWPADSPCRIAGVPHDPGEQDALYVDAIARAAASVWTDAQGTEHGLVITSADQLCETAQGEPTLPASIALRSADGAVDMTLEGWFVRDGDLLAYDPSLTPGLGGSLATVTDHFGDFGLDLTGFEHVGIELALTLSTTGGDAELQIVGYRDECQQRCDANGCSGCGPLTQMTLLELSLSQRP